MANALWQVELETINDDCLSNSFDLVAQYNPVVIHKKI